MNRSLNIAISTLRYYPAIGGSESVVQNVCEKLAARGHNCSVYATTALEVADIFTPKPADETEEVINGVRVIRSPVSSFPYRDRVAKYLDKFSIYGHGCYSFRQMRRLLTEKYDVLLSGPFPSSHNYYSFLISKLRLKPITFFPFLHIDDFYHARRSSIYYMLKKSKGAIALTEYEKNFYVQKGTSDENVFVSGIGLDLKSYRKPPINMGIKEKYNAPFLIIYVGRKDEHKGIGLMIDAMKVISLKRQDIKLLCIGPETEYSKELWANLQPRVKDLIIVRGKVSDEEKRAFIAEADLLVLPSTTESFGIVYAEAWIEGKPVIGARSGAVVDVINEYEDGLLISPNNYIQLAVSIEYLIDNTEIRKLFGNRGKRKVLNGYTWDRVADVWETMLRKACK